MPTCVCARAFQGGVSIGCCGGTCHTPGRGTPSTRLKPESPPPPHTSILCVLRHLLAGEGLGAHVVCDIVFISSLYCTFCGAIIIVCTKLASDRCCTVSCIVMNAGEILDVDSHRLAWPSTVPLPVVHMGFHGPLTWNSNPLARQHGFLPALWLKWYHLRYQQWDEARVQEGAHNPLRIAQHHSPHTGHGRVPVLDPDVHVPPEPHSTHHLVFFHPVLQSAI